MLNHKDLKLGLTFWLLLLITVGIYWQGLSSFFLFDDGSNLEGLSNIKAEDWWISTARFISEGITGQIGRPLSLTSFALQYYEWPNPWPFKYVNLMIHLLNGTLIFWLVYSLGRFLPLSRTQVNWLALCTAGLWLLHPLHASTVLYAVQRMTQLSAFFILASLLGYVYSRAALSKGQLKRGYIGVSLSVGLGGILAVLSKENGILLVLYILVLEQTLLRNLPRPLYWRFWQIIFIYLPLGALIGYLLLSFPVILQTYQIRDFSLGERLLTQTRVLSEYLGKILLVYPYDFGLFHDDFVISTHFWQPLNTLISLPFIIGLISVAIYMRKRWPIFSFAILWFFAGHILESSFIGLIIYFEHRNYLPMLGILLAVVYAFFYFFNQLSVIRHRYLLLSFFAIWLLAVPIVTHWQTSLWATPTLQAMVWAQQKPTSQFAQSYAAAVMEHIGHPQETLKYYHRLVNNFPDKTSGYLLWASLACEYPQISPPSQRLLLERLQTGQVDNGLIPALNFLLRNWEKSSCYLSGKEVERILLTTLQNPTVSIYEKNIRHLLGMLYAQHQQYTEAVKQLNLALQQGKTIPIVYFQRIAWSFLNQKPAQAKQYFEEMRVAKPWIKYLYPKDFNYWQAKLENN